VLAALRFTTPQRDLLARLTENEWKKALWFCDRTQLTLPLGLRCPEFLSGKVRSRIDHNLSSNAERWQRVKTAYLEIAESFQAEGLESVVLKGFSQCSDFVADPRHRVQYDVDLLLPRHEVMRARDISAGLGYEPLCGFDHFPIDHLPAMIRKTGWEWRGDPFDIEIPVSLELHFRLWDAETERFGPNGLEQFWERRRSRRLDGICFMGFHPADAVGYASLHLLRHLLRGDLRPSHVYELAFLLHSKAEDKQFWRVWNELHDDSLRRLEAICFALAQCWFHCRLPGVAIEEIDRLPSEINRWLAVHSASPLLGLFHPNKDELWLHWNLLNSTGARVDVLRRRLLPQRLPGPVDAVHLSEEQITPRIRLRRRWRYAAYLVSRVAHHFLALPAVGWSSVRWFSTGVGLGAPYWRFFLAAGLFDFGLFIFFLLYNLYLLQLGFSESFLGLVSGAMTAGGVVGSIPAAIAIGRYGIRNTLLAGFSLIFCLSALRAYVTLAPALLAFAFAAGMVAAVWAVAISPAVAQLTDVKNRPLGFSLVFSSGIAIGVLGGLAGGRLPGWLSRLHLASSSAGAYRGSLLLGCAFVLLALWPLSRVKIGAAPPAKRKIYRPSPWVIRFLIAMAAWNLGTGAFNPFFNAFFARLHMPVERIGFVFSSAQLTQVGAVLLAPLVFRRFGIARGVSAMQSATALALVALAAAGGPAWAGFGYMAYMVSQYMSEPGLYAFLMDGVPAGERSGASALNFLVVSGAQAIAAAVAGVALDRLGYAPVLIAAAIICALAALLFRVLFARSTPDSE